MKYYSVFCLFCFIVNIFLYPSFSLHIRWLNDIQCRLFLRSAAPDRRADLVVLVEHQQTQSTKSCPHTTCVVPIITITTTITRPRPFPPPRRRQTRAATRRAPTTSSAISLVMIVSSSWAPLRDQLPRTFPLCALPRWYVTYSSGIVVEVAMAKWRSDATSWTKVTSSQPYQLCVWSTINRLSSLNSRRILTL